MEPHPQRTPFWMSLTAILLLAFGLRCWRPAAMQVEHFDEGVYASNLFSGGHLENRYPDQHLYAPPLQPLLLEWTLILGGGHPHAAIWLNVFLGTALTGAVYWAGWEWFDKSTAVVAGVLAATSDFAILFSRSALTDTPMCLWLTLGLVAGVRALRRGSWFWIGCTVLCGALGWWTKYNGWLLPAMLGAGTAGWWLQGWVLCRLGRPVPANSQQLVLPMLQRYGLILLGIVLLWLPVLWQLEQHGGYAAVAANHRGYFVGLTGWTDSLQRQFAVQWYLLGTVTFIGLIFAWGYLVWRQAHLTRGCRWSDLGMLLLLAGVFLSTGLGLWMLVPVGAVMLWQQTSVASVNVSGPVDSALPTATDPAAHLSRWILAAWVISLLVAVPLYRPYPRLQLPLQVGLWLVCGRSLVLLAWSVRGFCHPWLLVAFSGLGLLIHGGGQVAWQSRSGLAVVSRTVRHDLGETLAKLPPARIADVDCVLYVLAEPGLYYHLAAGQGGNPNYLVTPAGNLSVTAPGATDRRVPTLLLTGPHAHRDHPELLLDQTLPAQRLKLLKEYPYEPSDLVLLDDMPPSDLESHRQQVIRVWVIGP